MRSHEFFDVFSSVCPTLRLCRQQRTRFFPRYDARPKRMATLALGQERFEKGPSISVGSWRGKFWRRWSEAIAEARSHPEQSQRGTLARDVDGRADRSHSSESKISDLRGHANGEEQEALLFPGHMARRILALLPNGSRWCVHTRSRIQNLPTCSNCCRWSDHDASDDASDDETSEQKTRWRGLHAEARQALQDWEKRFPFRADTGRSR